MADGMRFLRVLHLIHCDPKRGDVLVDGSGRAKIANFGLSKFSVSTVTLASIHRIRRELASYVCADCKRLSCP